MSAFQVSPEHVAAMLRSAIALGRLDRHPFRYAFAQKQVVVEDELERVGWTLWDENARSVRARYPDADEHEMIAPAPLEKSRWGRLVRSSSDRTPTPVETLSICACYRYQACETGDFESTEAGAFFDALREAAIRHLPGYDEAPWEWTIARRPAVARS